MQNPGQDEGPDQSFSGTQTVTLNTRVRSDPQQDESEHEPESNQGTPEPKSPPPLELIKFRVQQLRNRRFVLLKMQHFKKKAGDGSSGHTEEMTCEDSEDSDEVCELEAIQKELEELLVKKEELEKKGKRCSLTATGGQQGACPPFYKTETPHGGIYLLPPLQPAQEDATPEQGVRTVPAAETPTGPVVPVDSLGGTPAITQCPSCKEVILTETHSTVGDTVWLLCCLCSMMGCVAGCCLIPFFMDQMKDIQHQCPRCQTHISTHQPL
ncbi:uncharacterized protein [Trachinotus anak]|uniref:uncharacterized protein n=1 Tax=Trachinotus anak TaxID=443729 RepID=UPI0039F1A112